MSNSNTLSIAISLMGFYLAIITFFSSIFLLRLVTWYAEVKSNIISWNHIKNKSNPDIEDLKRLRHKARDLQCATPSFIFFALIVYIALISYYGYKLADYIQDTSFPLEFIVKPAGIFILIIFVTSISLIVKGKYDIDKNYTNIDERMQGSQANGYNNTILENLSIKIMHGLFGFFFIIDSLVISIYISISGLQNHIRIWGEASCLGISISSWNAPLYYLWVGIIIDILLFILLTISGLFLLARLLYARLKLKVVHS